ncbi:hypothetical protein [Lysobacter arvi]|uniref:Uncharacterized protein n=1 Tax=Lysobacter arvi TaxID=3038776 RepID=A0ABU1CIC5_9GAMM|nr:hypothetical protein [Lysobacter arvi]MDR0184702.1 hypothetical protein [Lysobacter arvi]
MVSHDVRAGLFPLVLILAAGCQRTDAPAPPASSEPRTPVATQTAAPGVDPAERAFQRRAVEAVNWGMPAVNFQLMYDAFVANGGRWNQVLYWSRLPDWKNQTLTPNPDVIYAMPSSTYAGYALLRSNIGSGSGADIARTWQLPDLEKVTAAR